MIATAKIVGYDGETLQVKPLVYIDRELMQKNVGEIEIRLTDGREISAEQRKKIFALIRDISSWCGDEPEYIRQFTEFEYRLQNGLEPFSLSDCDMSTAREYINYLIDFCFRHSVPTRDTLLNRTDDINKYLYSCLAHRRCAVCNDKADVHHIDAIGMGRDRTEIIHKGMDAIALCRRHHQEAHTRGKIFFEYHHIYGIKLDEHLCKILNLRSK
ncbi:MAG: hypothetical protein IKU66_05400 [Clostridia bacterium]|nr:hypothetical protein [Clostridia bacterium]